MTSGPAARVRRATPADAAALPGVERSAGDLFRTLPGLGWLADGEPIAEAHHRRWIASGTVWVAVDPHGEPDAPVGFLDAEAFDDALHVWEMSVHRRWQGRGIGRALLDAASAHACDVGLARLTLTTFSDVPWNAPYYARMGFTRIDASALCTRLQSVLEAEIAAGLPAARRCAMQRWTNATAGTSGITGSA
ncbi:GNAT family N-acetyltransferase [Pandoraea nosoerga]|uniref:GNAT family N-acetyltransferase n=1 Tax=Pandoraea nosoerga TaxID=2508296 RepID=A0A5E4SCL7_9BURK|nr:GNAT family N-acetyltransferase [Pandoraea nosoerga]MBN4666976.1 GNAT family N-acetyltransferase [Pandoraea nosoerga]MBN4674809.1 GNAT family N-acetyltransferase [Pandoraea nosoerga]MBN4681787.1 GNAT family N-acetyltransferase [Pandoraea nosoerga]MBN4744104.1 GNAT family N-acetyltransferase [Pandoraea nosoerga]VVD72901.1 GNAT family N-acetyltransferase [Pandoraea nosoerga]